MELQIGVLTILSGTFGTLGEDGLRGVQLAVDEFGGEVAGHKIKLVVESGIGAPDVAFSKAEKLIDKDKVPILVGPLSGNEGLAVRNFARTRPDHTFLNGASGAQDLTFRNETPNFFNFGLLGCQCLVGLGAYAYHTLGYRRVVTLGEDYSYPYSQIGAFTLEYCGEGGRIIDKLWVPVGASDYTNVIRAIPDEAEAVLVALGGTDAINFGRQYEQSGRLKPLLGGAITTDQSVLSSRELETDCLVGVIAAGPTADDLDHQPWRDFVAFYRERHPYGLNFPCYFALEYYLNAKAALLALQAVDGDLADGHAAFRQALATLHFDGPSGPVRLDAHRQAISTNFISVVERDADGCLYRKLVHQVQSVSQTLGMNENDYAALGTFTRDNPPC